ncbi:MAG: UvrD-helicase domain-containing protein [Oscillospiraceae bacterium]
MKARREEVKKALSELTERLFCATSAEFQDDIADLRPKIRLLFDLVTAFGTALDERKRAKNAVDFADLEHFALRLLVHKTPEGVRPTEDAAGLSEQFAEVLVDEYQDTNEVQDMIFRSVSDGGKKLFMVGDVKQSIYRFRQAMPEIFIRNLNAYQPYGEGFPAKIILSKNFRSRTGVTGAVNFLFSQLMSVPLGELAYDSGQRLVAGASFGKCGRCQTESWTPTRRTTERRRRC